MSDTNWKKLKNNLRGEVYSDAVIEALENGAISFNDAKEFLKQKNTVYGLMLPELEKELKAVFQKRTGLAYPENARDGIEKFAYEAIGDTLMENAKTFGPSFSMFIGGKEILVATEKAIIALGLNPSDIPHSNMRVPSKTEQPYRPVPAF